MSETFEFRQYRGDGTTRDGRPARSTDEPGAYLAEEDLVAAVNTALAVERPLLVTGEAGTGKSRLADSIAAELELGEVEKFVVRSDHRGRDLLFQVDDMQRFFDSHVGEAKARDRVNYLQLGVLGRAFESERRRVVLVDEIDKSPRDFPNDLLDALDRMEIRIPELGVLVRAKHRPIVVITSNRETQLPDPFLRRCVFHHILFPEPGLLHRILNERLGDLALGDAFRERLVARFLEVRAKGGWQKAPSTGEMLIWARVLHRAGIDLEQLDGKLRDLPFPGALLKTREDVTRMRESTD